eukprot:403337744
MQQKESPIYQSNSSLYIPETLSLLTQQINEDQSQDPITQLKSINGNLPYQTNFSPTQANLMKDCSPKQQKYDANSHKPSSQNPQGQVLMNLSKYDDCNNSATRHDSNFSLPDRDSTQIIGSDLEESKLDNQTDQKMLLAGECPQYTQVDTGLDMGKDQQVLDPELMPKLVRYTPPIDCGTQISERAQQLISSILTLELFKTYSDPMRVRGLRAITNSIDGDLKLYKKSWNSLIEYEVYSKLTSAQVLNSIQSTDSRHAQVMDFKLSFIFDKNNGILLPVKDKSFLSSEQLMQERQCQTDTFFSDVKAFDVVIISQNPLQISQKSEILPQLVEYVKQNIHNQGKLVLGVCQSQFNQGNDNSTIDYLPCKVSIKLSENHFSMMQTLAARSEDQSGTIHLHVYFLRSIAKDCAQLIALDGISEESSEKGSRIFRYMLTPRRGKARVILDAFDKVQGQMEQNVQQAQSERCITFNQNELLTKFIQFQKENLIIINGMSGSGKTVSALTIAILKLYSGTRKVLYLVPNYESLFCITRMINSSMLFKGHVLKQNLLILDGESSPSRYEELSDSCLSKLFSNTFNFHLKMQSTSSEPYEINSLNILQQVFQNSQFILGTFEFLHHQNLNYLIPQIQTIIIDDAHSMSEPDLLLTFQMNPYQLILVGCEELPRTQVYSHNAMTTQFSKSTLERMIEQDFNYFKMRGQLRVGHIQCQIINRMLYKNNTIQMNAPRQQQTAFNDDLTCLRNFMRRVLLFDLTYLLELKQSSFKSDFDEINFTISLIGDLTRLVSEIEGIRATRDDDRMQHSFSKLRGHIGIVVPHERCIDSFKLFFKNLEKKLGISSEEGDCNNGDVYVGTPQMFRGVEKHIIIVCGLRNSQVDGLGQLEDAQNIKLIMTRAKSFLWVVGSSPWFMHNQYWKDFLMASKLISVGQYNNYIPFENFKDWSYPKMRDMLRSFVRRGGDRSPTNRSPKNNRSDRNDNADGPQNRSRSPRGNYRGGRREGSRSPKNNNHSRFDNSQNNHHRNQYSHQQQQQKGMSYQERLQQMLTVGSGNNQRRHLQQMEREKEREHKERQDMWNKRKPTERDWDAVDSGNLSFNTLQQQKDNSPKRRYERYPPQTSVKSEEDGWSTSSSRQIDNYAIDKKEQQQSNDYW